MQHLIATTSEVVHLIALQAVHYNPLQEVHLSRYWHCTENKESRKSRLQELGISEGSYYYTKSLLREEGQIGGSFIQLSSGAPAPLLQHTSRSKKDKPLTEAVTIEIRTPSGTEMRIIGCLQPEMLKTIIGNV